jgi:aspartate dehydrogenase
MQTIAIIGCGAIGEAVAGYLADRQSVEIVVAIVEAGMEARARTVFGDNVEIVQTFDRANRQVNLAVDCAGHSALRQHGATILSQGIDLITVSSGALADAQLHESLIAAARDGGAQLRVVSGAIGALDVLAAGSIGALAHVTYRGRKPPAGWRGSAAEEKLNLDAISKAEVHFRGTARAAALEYPKNANVAASVALAGVGFDATKVELIADPTIERNIHEVEAEGDFGRFTFRIEGNSLPGNPRSSSITAMSVVREILGPGSAIVIKG